MALELSDLQNNVYLVLDEALTSVIGNLEAGGGASAVQDTVDTITQYLNLAQIVAARSVFFLNGSGTKALTGNPATLDIATVTVDVLTGATFWAAREVSWKIGTNPTTILEWQDFKTAQRRRILAPNAPATPKRWSVLNGVQDTIVFDPQPNADATVGIQGFVMPPPLVDPTDDVAWIETDSNAEFLWLQAALDLCAKAIEDPKVAARYGVIKDMRDAKRRAMRSRLDQALVDQYMEPLPPVYTPQPRGRATR